MNIYQISRQAWFPFGAALMFAASALGTAYSNAATKDYEVTLNGDQEVPAVKSMGAGSGEIIVGTDGSVSGSVTTRGVVGTAAHIHLAESGMNGPVVIALIKNGDTYTVPAGSKLTDAQYASYKEGKLYVNIHTAENQGGEIRGQLQH